MTKVQSRFLGPILIGALLSFGCGGSGGDGDAAPSGSDIVVSVDWLMERQMDPNVQIVDGRSLGYDGGHIPGAIPVSPTALAATVDGVNLQISPPEVAQSVFQGAGIDSGTTVVVYGQSPEFDPARVVWALYFYGHQDVRYLDGGFPAWVAAGGATADGPPVARPGNFTITEVREDQRVTGDWVLSQLGDPPYANPAIQIVDARSPGEWELGRIPGAIHVRWTDNLSEPNGNFRPMSEVDALYAGLDPTRTTVTYCLVGWRASVAWLTLRWLGYDDVRVYDGSWEEWGSGPFPTTP